MEETTQPIVVKIILIESLTGSDPHITALTEDVGNKKPFEFL